jgi:hypothetical protein
VFFLFLTPYFLRRPTQKIPLGAVSAKIVIIAQHVIIETQRRIVDGRRKRLDAVQ